VVVPNAAPRAKRDRIAACGARVVLGPTPHYDDAEAEAIALAERRATHFVSAYDDLDVLAGNGASLGFDIVRALGRVPDAVVVPLGGGGLATGLACALAAEEGEDPAAPSTRRRVWGVQSEACPAMARSLEDGRVHERMESDDTLADGLEGGIRTRAFVRAAAVTAGVAVVSERAILEALGFGLRELGLVLEGSAACALVPTFAGLPAPICGGDVVFVLTGRNVDRAVIDRALGPRAT
jgi:threonine dehydratase